MAHRLTDRQRWVLACASFGGLHRETYEDPKTKIMCSRYYIADREVTSDARSLINRKLLVVKKDGTIQAR